MAKTAPSVSDLKKLFARSGNHCAFPKCKAPLALGNTLVGQICHIKGEKLGSARYDASQTPEQRHGYDNLILLCSPHHTVIDNDERTYTVECLHQMKEAHEAKATPIDDQTAQQVASSFVVVSSVGQVGGITANHVTLNSGQVGDAALQQRKLQAKENLWNMICKYHDEFSMVIYVDNIFTAKELDEYFSQGLHAGPIGVVSDYRNPNFVANKFKAANPDKERPFVSQRLWSIVYTVRALYGRAGLLIQWSYERRAFQDWRTDRGMAQIMRAIIPDHVVDDLKKRPIGGLVAAVHYLQNQFLTEAGMQ